MHEDSKIVDRLLAGDESAFKAVFDNYFPRLYRFALARLDGDADEAVDLVQQTFCRAFERLDSWRGEASLFGWMVQICRNAIVDRARRIGARPLHVSLGEHDEAITALVAALHVPECEQPDARVARLELLQVVQATLDYLPSHYGDVLEWKYIEGNSVSDIAERLDVTPKAAESLLTRARSAFREAIATLYESADLLPFAIDKGITHARD